MKSSQPLRTANFGHLATTRNLSVTSNTQNSVEHILHTPGILSIGNMNTTIAYCSYNDSGELEYIFVHPSFRRKGYAKRLLKMVEETVQRRLVFQSPLSPLGSCLLNYDEHYSSQASI